MSDLIDRQALLKQIDIDSDGEPGYYGDTWKFIDTIKSMPPAELSTNLAEVGADLISRAEAQTELQLSARRYTVAHEAHGEGRVVWSEDLISVSDAMDVLRKIPSAQPKLLQPWEVLAAQAVLSHPAEPKRGKWIRDGHHIRCDQCGMYMCDTDREGDRIPTEFCPNCGADMREVIT